MRFSDLSSMPKQVTKGALYGLNEFVIDTQLHCLFQRHLTGLGEVREHAWADRHFDDVVQIGEPDLNRKGGDLTDNATAFKLDAVSFMEVGHVLLFCHLRLLTERGASCRKGPSDQLLLR